LVLMFTHHISICRWDSEPRFQVTATCVYRVEPIFVKVGELNW
jgi:hypothetical protein